MTPILQVDSVHKTYRLGKVEVPVLRGVTISVDQGEWIAILGASGSGKSTLLHLIGGLDRPDRGPNGSPGDIRYRGTPLSGMSASELDRYRSRNVGFVFQAYHLLPELTVLGNVLLGAMVRHGRVGFMTKRGEATSRAKALLDTMGLSHRLSHRPRELSGGERQRVAIARSLVNQPDLLLADEPTGNLDRTTGEAILDAITATRNPSENRTLIMVTHDEQIAARADRVVRLEDGIVTAGSTTSAEAEA
ncbi:MAG: ABC transporter ATP-binding protein [Planctomycetota bacterium]